MVNIFMVYNVCLEIVYIIFYVNFYLNVQIPVQPLKINIFNSYLF